MRGLRFSRSALKRQQNAAAQQAKVTKIQKRAVAKEQAMSKSIKMETEKRDFFIKKLEEKHATVLSKKKDIDHAYELKMKELSRAIRLRDSNTA